MTSNTVRARLLFSFQGEAQQFPAIKGFSLSLSKNNDLAHFTWQAPEPNQSTRGWEFNYTAEVPRAETEE